MKKRYSIFLTPISILVDLTVINLTMFLLLKDFNLTSIFYFNFLWLLISLNTKIYEVYRYTKLTSIISRLFIQFAVYFLSYFAYFSIFSKISQTENSLQILTTVFSAILILKLVYLYSLRKYRLGGGNFRDVIILGENQSIESLRSFFNIRNDLGYRFKGYFSNKNKTKNNFLGEIEESYNYVLLNKIDEIFCSISDLSKEDVKKVILFGENNNITVKLIPDSTGIFNKGMVIDYYDYIPILTLKKLPFDEPLIKYSKRFFDIVFSLLIVVFVLSWISIILFIVIKLESKGPLIFKQLRDGLNGKQFYCYKFRSMGLNNRANKNQTIKDDIRITRVGKFIRKTSIDELPQFINVLKGEMSVVGPRPHMISQTKKYSQVVKKYFIRNLVKPGVTGLSQVRGYRGEIEEISDMENRVRLDIFYINKWSFLLDIKIIIETFINILKGEQKAY